MNTKGIKFLAVLAVLAMAFAFVAFASSAEDSDAGDFTVKADVANLHDQAEKIKDDALFTSYTVTTSAAAGYTNVVVTITDLQAHTNAQPAVNYWAGCSFIPSEWKSVEYKIGDSKEEITGAGTVQAEADVNANGKGDNGIAFYLTAGIKEKWLGLKWSGDENYTIYCIKQDITVVHADGVEINATGAYAYSTYNASNASLGNSVKVTEVETPAAGAYAEYNIDAKLAYIADYAAAKLDNTGSGYAIIWQITGLKPFDAWLGGSLPYDAKWSSDLVWQTWKAPESDNTQETFALYISKDKAATITGGTMELYFNPSKMETSSSTAGAAKIILNFNVSFINEDEVKKDAAGAKEALNDKTDTGETKNKTVELQVTAATDLGTDIVVNNDQTFVIAAIGDGAVTGTITIGTGSDASKVGLAGLKGTVEITKGSIKVFGNPWSAGTITLYDKDVAKLSGDITGNVTFAYGDENGSAKIIVEADTVLNIAKEKTLSITSNKISVEIAGEVYGEVYDGDKTKNGALANATSKIAIFDGAIVSGLRITGTGDITVFSGSDINDAVIDNVPAIKGKDAASGTWSYNGTKKTLTLNNYNGTYNFGVIPVDIEKIELNGDNVVTVKAPIERSVMIDTDKVYVLFGGKKLTSITTDAAGSLSIVADISDVKGEDLHEYSAAILGGDSAGTKPLKINGVSINIFVDGSNTTWTDAQKKSMNIAGILADYNIEFFDAPVMVKIMPDYEAEGLIGIAVDGTLDIVGKTMLIEAVKGLGATGEATIKTAAVGVKGEAKFTAALTISNASEFMVEGFLDAKAITISQETQVAIKDAKIAGKLDNKGIVAFNGNVMVTDAGIIENHAIMVNNGYIGVFGKFINTASVSTDPAVFTNNGTLSIHAMTQRTTGVPPEPVVPVTTATLTITDATTAETRPAAGNVKLNSISITGAELMYDGSITFKATIMVYNSTGAAVAVADEFEGVVIPGLNGYVLTMHSSTATITVDFDPSKAASVGKGYKVDVVGNVKVGEESMHLVGNTAEAAVPTDTVKLGGLFVASGADFDINEGIVNNDKTIVVSASSDAAIIASKATFNGNLVTFINAVTIAGTFNGNLTAAGEGKVTVGAFTGDILSQGSVDVSASKTMIGNIIAKGDVTINGNLGGNITTEGNVVVKAMIGEITVDRLNDDPAAKTVTLDGAVIAKITYNSFYKETTTATEPTKFTAVMDVLGTPKGLVLDLAKGSDATASADAVAGYFRINATGALAENKTVDMALTEGRLLVDTPVVLEARYYLTIEAGATIEVNKSAASLDVKKAALKVSKDANALFEIGSATPVEYGKVLFIMAFEIDGGAYTIYSDVAYALLNCDEGTELYVGESATIDQDVIVKKGVNIVVEDITLTFNGKDVEMLEDAKITLEGTGKVVFKPTDSNVASIKKDETITYYTVSATIVYEDNTVIFEDARFAEDSTIQGVAATSTAAAKIKTDLAVQAGEAMVKGLGTGSIKLSNALYPETKDSAEPETFCVCGTFVVGADAVFDAVSIVDMPETVRYKAVTDGFEIKEVVKYPTVVGVEGTLNLLNNTTVLGSYIGTGKVTIAANNTLTVDKGDAEGLGIEPKNYPGSLNTYVVDTTDNANGYLFNFTAPVAGSENLILKAEKVTISGEKVDAVTIKGTVATLSIIRATDDAFLNGLTLYRGTAIYGEDVYVLADSSTQEGATGEGGFVGAKNIHMGEAPFANLEYQTVVEDEGYYIYSMFGSVDWDEVTELDVVIEKGVVNINQKLDLTGKDVNIVIGEKATFNVNSVMIIGTPATVIGDEGSSIVGKVIIAEDAKAYLIAYADVDLTGAEIVSAVAGNPDAVFSKLDIEDVVYAAIFASNQGADPADHVILAKADAAIIPAIVGYNFTAWLNYNGDAKAEVGETNAYADARAVYLTVKVKYVEGVDYYMNGVLFNVYDIPTDVPFGSYFTAKISDTTKYQGNPVINGEKTVCVMDDMELVASGVTPIPEPEPEPVIGDSGLSLTDILLIVLVILIAIMVVILVLRLNRS